MHTRCHVHDGHHKLTKSQNFGKRLLMFSIEFGGGWEFPVISHAGFSPITLGDW